MKGQRAEDGATRIAPNGYHYEKISGRWRLRHHLTAEAKLGRPLRTDEMVRFKAGKGPADWADPEAIEVVTKGTLPKSRRVHQLRVKIADALSELEELTGELYESVRTELKL